MRFLNKVFFLNSATIPFAEVQLNGNVHLIGTQGVGKSTLLRAILFFYNADSLKLGISKEKKSFSEYYFPFSNSYVIYEVQRETGSFCIVASQTSRKVFFRIIEAAFDKKFFLSEDGMAFEKWDQTRKVLDEANIYYSAKIDSYEEYRNILYGNPEHQQKNLNRFWILQSKQYKNIPRTIQNVFLNSKLDAEFIKETIINSLNEEDIQIDLSSYAHHLKDFERQLGDIHKYKEPAVRKFAELAVERLQETRLLETKKSTLAQQLSWSANQARNMIPKLRKSLNALENTKTKQLEHFNSVQTRHLNKTAKLREQISFHDRDLKKSKEQAAYYHSLGIDKIIALSTQKPSLEIQLKQLNQEKLSFEAQFSEVARKYENIFQALSNSLNEFKNEIQSQKSALTEARFSAERAEEKAAHSINEQLRVTAGENQDQVREKLSAQQVFTHELRSDYAVTKATGLYSEELRKLQIQLDRLENKIGADARQIEQLVSQQQVYQKQGELEQEKAAHESKTESKLIQEKISQLKSGLINLEEKLGNKNSFYNWLNINVTGWENNIGKVVSENLLRNDSLAPTSDSDSPGTANYFYGIQLDLSEIEPTIQNPAELTLQKNKVEHEIREAEKSLKATQESAETTSEKIRKKYSGLLKTGKETLTKLRFETENDKANHKQTQINLESLRQKAKQEKDQKLEAIQQKIQESGDEELAIRQELEAINKELNKQLNTKQKELAKRIEAIKQEISSAINLLNQKSQQFEADIHDKRSNAEEQQANELAGKGIDASILKDLNQKISSATKTLEQINANSTTLSEYLKDKRELFDKEPVYRAEKLASEQQLSIEENKFSVAKGKSDMELEATDNEIRTHLRELDRNQSNLNVFENFKISETWVELSSNLPEPGEEFQTDKDCRELIDNINETVHAADRKLEMLKENINRFSGHFSNENIFNFRISFASNADYTEFADSLGEFILNSKISEYERRVNERFATIINTVGNQTASLMSRQGEIQRVIREINEDFKGRNFVKAIQKIELKLDPSVNRVVQLLLEIKKFNDINSLDLGGMNLFSSADQHSKNQEATKLLSQFGKAIFDNKQEIISLSDSFELKFRIEENNNDTNWVEKLSNVGSEGTDVLVKAMINIMLLNVFKKAASRKFKDFHLHCMMDEIGKLHPNNVRGILQFANDRNIFLINGSPTENNALDYKHIYKLEKDVKRNTKIKKIISKIA